MTNSMLLKVNEQAHVRRFTQEIEKIEQNIIDVKRMTAEAIATLEERKRELRQSTDPNAIYKETDEIDKQIADISGCRDEFLRQISSKHEEVTKQKMSIDKLERNIAEMDREISHIHAQQDKALLDLEQRKTSLSRKLSAIEKLDLLIDVLTHKIFEIQHEYRKDLEELHRQRDILLKQTDATDNQRALLLAELDRKIADRKNVHEATLASLEGQRTELRRESVLKIQHIDTALESLKEQYERMLVDLEAQKLGATPSQIEEINRQIAELNRMYEKDMENLKRLQGIGWKETSNQEKISAMLEARGLRVTMSGNFLTASGQLLSRSEAECMGLLKGIDITSWDNVLQERRSDIGSSRTETVLTPVSSSTSELSKMSSEDVHYLKTALGKPLTLALAEITAIQPRDPIHYLGHWLFKYRYNQEIDLVKKRDIQDLLDERERIEKEALHAMMQDEAQQVVLDMVIRAEEEAIRRELERIARETAMLENEAEEQDSLGVHGSLNEVPTK